MVIRLIDIEGQSWLYRINEEGLSVEVDLILLYKFIILDELFLWGWSRKREGESFGIGFSRQMQTQKGDHILLLARIHFINVIYDVETPAKITKIFGILSIMNPSYLSHV